MAVSATLVVTSGPRQGERIGLTAGRDAVVGRKSDCDVVVVDGYMSRHHFRLIFDGEQVYLDDLESSHGTTLNSVRISERKQLNSGDRIRAGTTDFTVEVGSSRTQLVGLPSPPEAPAATPMMGSGVAIPSVGGDIGGSFAGFLEPPSTSWVQPPIQRPEKKKTTFEPDPAAQASNSHQRGAADPAGDDFGNEWESMVDPAAVKHQPPPPPAPLTHPTHSDDSFADVEAFSPEHRPEPARSAPPSKPLAPRVPPSAFFPPPSPPAPPPTQFSPPPVTHGTESPPATQPARPAANGPVPTTAAEMSSFPAAPEPAVDASSSFFPSAPAEPTSPRPADEAFDASRAPLEDAPTSRQPLPLDALASAFSSPSAFWPDHPSAGPLASRSVSPPAVPQNPPAPVTSPPVPPIAATPPRPSPVAPPPAPPPTPVPAPAAGEPDDLSWWPEDA